MDVLWILPYVGTFEKFNGTWDIPWEMIGYVVFSISFVLMFRNAVEFVAKWQPSPNFLSYLPVCDTEVETWIIHGMMSSKSPSKEAMRTNFEVFKENRR